MGDIIISLYLYIMEKKQIFYRNFKDKNISYIKIV